MKRLFALLIAVLLPLQLAWGAAAAYCQHDADAKPHFGHHAHVHVDGAKQQQQAKTGGLLPDLDCGFCHAGGAVALPSFDAPPTLTAQAPAPRSLGDPHPPSAPQRAPDRPQWPRLA